MEIVRSINRSWICDTYNISAYTELFIRGKSLGEIPEMSEGKCPNTGKNRARCKKPQLCIRLIVIPSVCVSLVLYIALESIHTETVSYPGPMAYGATVKFDFRQE